MINYFGRFPTGRALRYNLFCLVFLDEKKKDFLPTLRDNP
jgi:hypothetical protein